MDTGPHLSNSNRRYRYGGVKRPDTFVKSVAPFPNKYKIELDKIRTEFEERFKLLDEEIKQLKEENNHLKNQIQYMPGNEGYYEALKDFEERLNNQS